MNFNDITKYTQTEDKAREFLEAERWPKGAICPHCGVEGESYRLRGKEGSKSPVRPGVWKCGGCRKQFTVKVGTIFEDSHIPLTTWLKAIHLLCASKKGMSAHQLHRMLGVTYKSAWFMAHRIRYAMSQEPLSSKLTGIVEIDETFVGGKLRTGPHAVRQGQRPQDRLVGTANKAIVLSVLQRGGRVQSQHISMVASPGIGSHSVLLAGGGRLTITINANPFTVPAEDRTFFFELVDKLQDYGAKHPEVQKATKEKEEEE